MIKKNSLILNWMYECMYEFVFKLYVNCCSVFLTVVAQFYKINFFFLHHFYMCTILLPFKIELYSLSSLIFLFLKCYFCFRILEEIDLYLNRSFSLFFSLSLFLALIHFISVTSILIFVIFFLFLIIFRLIFIIFILHR